MNDLPLLPQVAQGNPAAFPAAVERYGALVWSIASRRCSNRADTEDVVQEIFVALWQHADRFDGARARESTFVAMIARRRVIDRLRQRTRERDGLEALARDGAPSPRAIDAVEAGPDARRALEAIDALPEDQRRILALSLSKGLSHREIAETTDLPIGTVKSHLRRGLERVRQSLAGARR